MNIKEIEKILKASNLKNIQLVEEINTKNGFVDDEHILCIIPKYTELEKYFESFNLLHYSTKGLLTKEAFKLTKENEYQISMSTFANETILPAFKILQNLAKAFTTSSWDFKTTIIKIYVKENFPILLENKWVKIWIVPRLENE